MLYDVPAFGTDLILEKKAQRALCRSPDANGYIASDRTLRSANPTFSDENMKMSAQIGSRSIDAGLFGTAGKILANARGARRPWFGQIIRGILVRECSLTYLFGVPLTHSPGHLSLHFAKWFWYSAAGSANDRPGYVPAAIPLICFPNLADGSIGPHLSSLIGLGLLLV
jgi:hypothetical protein